MKTNKRQILIEGRVEDLKAKYVSNGKLNPIKKIKEWDFNVLVKGDPSGNQKYLEWLIKTMIRGYSLGIGTHYLLNLVKEFHENQQRLPKKDLYQYSGYNELEKALKDLQPSKSDMKKIQKSGSHKLYEDEQYLIVAPRTELGSCYYGQGTRWCTSAKRQNAFETYNEDGTLIYIINKQGGGKGDEVDEDGFTRDYSKIAMFIDFDIYEQGMKYLNSPDIKLYDATDSDISEDAIWSDFVFGVSEETKLKMQDAMVKYFIADWNERAPFGGGDEFGERYTEGLENLIYIKGLLNEINESDFDWTSDLPAEDDVVFLNLTVGEPDLDEYYDDAADEDDIEYEWHYWNLYLYIPKQVYRDITGMQEFSGEWDEWSIHEKEGEALLDHFYEHNFDRKQKHGLSTAISVNDMDGGFTVVNKNLFCNKVGNFHPNKCNLYNR